MEKSGENMEGDNAAEEVTTEGGAGAIERRRFSTRSQASSRKAAEVTLLTSLRSMQLDEVEGNVSIHMVLTEQLLGILEKEHLDYVSKEGLDINKDPEKSYMREFEEKVRRAVDKHKAKFVSVDGNRKDPAAEVPELDTVEKQLADWGSASSMFSVTSKASRGPTLLMKLKHKRAKIQAKAQAVDNVISHADIKANPKSLTRAEVAWSKVEILRCEYEAIMDEAYEVIGDNEELKQGVEEDTKQVDWLMGIETKLEELLLLRESPEKKIENKAGGTSSHQPQVPPPSHNKTDDFLNTEPKTSDSVANQAFSGGVGAPGDTSAGDLEVAIQQSKFISLQAATNLENERKLLEQKAITEKLQQQLDSLRQVGGGQEL